jgi:PAS domain S-box-containing protein
MQSLLKQQDFKTLFDSTLDAILVADDDGVYVAANAAACELLKAPESSILGRTIADFTLPQKHSDSREGWRQFLKAGQVSGEIELRCADGSQIIVEYQAKANFIPGQHLSVLRDVTERKKAENALNESNRQVISTLESISDAVLAFDRDWNFTYANPQSEPILGKPPHEVFGKNLWEEYPGAAGTEFETAYLKAAREAVPVHFQGIFNRTGKWMEVHVYPSEVGITVYLRDISDRKRAEENLRFLAESGNVLSSSLEYDHIIEDLAQLAISYIADWCAIDVLEDGHITRLTVMHQDPAKVEIAHEFGRKYPPELDDPSGVSAVLRTGESVFLPELTDELLTASIPDPEKLAMLLSLGIKSVMMVPLVARGQTIGAMTLIRDVDGRNYTKEDLIVAQEFGRRAGSAVEKGRLFRERTNALRTAEEATRSRDEFLAIVSHELKTPMTPILGWINILREDSGSLDADSRNHALEVIDRNVRAQSQLVNDLLDISRIVTGKLRLDVRPLDLTSVIQAAVETVGPAADAKSIEVKVHVDEAAGLVMGDADRLQQVVWNLLANAIKFTPKSGMVTVGVKPVDSFVELMVRDTGQGMRREILPYVFDRFRQADSSSTREHGGLGLGLSIVRNLVELHGGTVAVDSPGLELGTTFTVRLPIAPVLAKTVSSEAASSADGVTTDRRVPSGESEGNSGESASDTPLSGLRILLIDDMQDSRELVAVVLRRYGAEVRDADSSEAGMAVLQQWLPDAVICDIGMPGEDGYGFIARLRALKPEQGGKIPAIALTAYGRLEDRLKALASGFQNHIIKPADPQELTITIASVTGRLGV